MILSRRPSSSPDRLARRPGWKRALLAATLLLAAPGARAASPPAADLCAAAIAATEPASHLPPRLLSAIALVESGRPDPATGRVAPWPWTINIAGTAAVFATEAQAIAAVAAAEAAGIRSIDIGCMQVNLLHHPDAFATLREAFDPAANVRYAARFLTTLHARSGDWAAAVAAYHSETPGLGGAYARRVAAAWPQAAQFGLIAMPGGVLSAAALAAEVDPHHALTPDFRREMIAAAAFRYRQAATPPAAPVARAATSMKAATLAKLEAQVDPHHVLTPAFRAQRVAAAVFRLRQRQEAGHPAVTVAKAGSGPKVSRVALAW